MTQTFYLKRGDTSPSLDYELEPVGDLAGASCAFNMMDSEGLPVVDAVAATILEPKTVRYSWRPQDTDTAGTYRAEFRVTYADGRHETFPNAGFITVLVGPSAGVTP